MKKALLLALFLVQSFCLAEKQHELTEETQKQLAALLDATSTSP